MHLLGKMKTEVKQIGKQINSELAEKGEYKKVKPKATKKAGRRR